MPDTTIGPYRILQKLAAGGMGEVFLCEDPRLGRRVALKRATGSWTESEEGRERLRREARAAAALNHPHIAAVYDVLESDAGPHVVMEYVEGETLSSMMRRGRVPLDRAVQIGIELAEAIGAAHAAGVVHRDLKPSNVMITRDGHVKVLDFGLAKHREGADVTRRGRPLTTAGAWVGTPGYTAPEQLLGDSDHRSDLYSFGAILFELFAGRPALEGGDALTLATAATKPIVPPGELDPAIPEPVSQLVVRLMSVRPSQRPRSADEVRTVLAAALDSLGEASTAVPAARQLRAPGRAVWIAAALALVLFGTAAYFKWRSDPAVTASPPRSLVLAVLPLDNVSGDNANDFLGNGFAASLITDLSTLPGLTVLSRAAVREAAATQDPTRVARQLGASYVLGGSVHRSGDRLRVDLVLTRADGSIEWSRPFTGTFGALLDLQPQLARAVGGALPLRVGQSVRDRLARAPTNNVDALAAYWRGKQLLDRVNTPAEATRAVQVFEEAVSLDPQFAAGFAGLAEASWTAYELTNEARWAERALVSSDRALALDRDQPHVWISRALVYHGTGRSQQALDDVAQALALQPDSDEALVLKGRILRDLGRTDEAIAALREAIAIRPGYWNTYNTLGLTYYRVGRLKEAIPALEKVVELQPDNARGYFNLGVTYYRLGDHDRALSYYQQALKVGPSPDAHAAIGNIQYARRDYDRAAKSFEAALKLAPNRAFYERNLGDVLQKLGQRARAREAYQRAVALTEQDLRVNPKDAMTVARLAVYQAKLSRDVAARQEIQKAISLAPRSAEVRYRAAVVHALLGSRQDALAELDRALQLGYSAASAREDEDLSSLAGNPEFEHLLAKAGGRSAP